MVRYFDTFFRFIGLMLVPIVLFPVLGALYMLASSSYTATAALWVETPIYVEQQRNTDGSTWDSPATQTSSLLNELMTTRAFLNSVVDSTSLKDEIKSEADRSAKLDYINKNYKVDAKGWRLINLSFKDTKSAQALNLLNSIVNNFKSYYDDRITRQGEGAVAYNESRVKAAKEALDKSNTALSEFISNNKGKISTEGTFRAVTPEDLQLQNLTQNRDAARKDYDDAKAALDKIQLQTVAYQKGLDTTLKIQDKPEVYSTTVGRNKEIAIGAGIGLAAGLLVAFLATIILTFLDHTYRRAGHFAQEFQVERVVELPAVNPVRGWKRRYKAEMAQRTAEGLNSKLLSSSPEPEISSEKRGSLEASAEASKESLDQGVVEGTYKAGKKVKPEFVLRQRFVEQLQTTHIK